MRLFTFATSPYARKIRMALDFKGLSYEPVERCYSLDHKPDLFAASPRLEVPALVLTTGARWRTPRSSANTWRMRFPARPCDRPILINARGCARSKICAIAYATRLPMATG